MKRLFVALFAAFVGIGFIAQDAEAKRLGGGKSSGMSRDSTVMKRDAAPAAPTAPTQQAAPAAAPTPQPAAAKPAGASRWLGPIAGLAAGIGLAALLSHFGLGEGFASILMVLLLVVAAVFVFRLLFRRGQPQPQYAGAAAGGPQVSHFEPAGAPAAGGAPAANIPAGFDVDGFLRQAKLNFIRLQAANDRGDMDDIKNFSTPEFFAEVQMQYEERGRAAQRTDVMQLNAELLDVSSEGTRHVASVRFLGQIRESGGAAVEAFDEVWHLTKPVDGSGGWVIAGIQQFQ